MYYNSADIKKEFDRKPVKNIFFLKTKIKSHGHQLTDFCNEKIPKVDCNHTCLAVINFDSALKKDDHYYPQAFLKECKYIEKKMIRHINENFSDFTSSSSSSSSDNDDDDESDEE